MAVPLTPLRVGLVSPYARVRRSSLSDGLRAWYAWDAWGIPRNRISNTVGSVSDITNATLVVDTFGPALAQTATTLVTLESNSGLVAPTGACTILIHMKRTAAAGNYSQFTIGTPGGTAAEALHAFIPYGADTKTYWRYGDNTGISFTDENGTGSWHVYGFTAGPLGLQIWKNGSLVASGAGPSSRTGNTTALTLNDPTNGNGKRVASFWIFHRQLNAGEMAIATRGEMLYREMLEVGPRRQYFFTPAAGGATITTATLPAGVGALGSGQTKAILPAGVGHMG